jgi:fatty acid amide hydrolase 2
MDEILTLSGKQIAQRIRAGKLTSVEAVTRHIAHIQRVNPALNAVVADRFEIALAEARAADRRTRRGGRLPPYHGVPCTIKECFALAGMPNTAGVTRRIGLYPERDAAAVRRLRDAGAIPLGVTNTSEGCMWMESDNHVYGRTNNPYDPTRIVGGSSGGEAAIIGAGGSPFGLGSDVGGSIRLPAFFNGVFGHKPSGGLVPVSGQFPCSYSATMRALTVGPLARRAEDLWPLLKVLAGPDGHDPGCRPMKMGDPAQVSMRGLNVLVVDGNGETPVAGELLAAQHRAALALERLGARVRPHAFDRLRRSRDIWLAMVGNLPGPTFSEMIGNGQPINPWLELAKCALRVSDHTFPAIVLALIELVPKQYRNVITRYAADGALLKQELADAIGPGGVMLFPTYPEVAPPHMSPLLPPFRWTYTAVLNAMEMPATAVPLGLNPQGLPLGAQVVGVHGADHVTVAVALALECELGGWIPPWTRDN